MGQFTATVQHLCGELLSPEESRGLLCLVDPATQCDMETVITFDDMLPGPSITRLRRILYAVADRDVFRPLQYCDIGFSSGFHHGDLEWRARDIVEMASLHIESLVKRMGRAGRLPLGAALGSAVVQRRVDSVTYGRIRRFVGVYNAAKHDFDHPMGTHLFSVEDAVSAYVICRKLALPLYSLAGLATDVRHYASV